VSENVLGAVARLLYTLIASREAEMPSSYCSDGLPISLQCNPASRSVGSMLKFKRGSFVLLLILAPACGGSSNGIPTPTPSPSPAQAPTVDQAFVPMGSFPTPTIGPNANVDYGQTLTVGVNGRLTGADLFFVVEPGASPTDVLVEVRSTSANLPTSTVLASGFIVATNIPNANSSSSVLNATNVSFAVHVDFTAPVTVSNGEVLALVCSLATSLPSATPGPTLLAAISSMATYSQGQAFFGRGQLWSSFGGASPVDFFFRTYVVRSS
jgi:hypothetical protein